MIAQNQQRITQLLQQGNQLVAQNPQRRVDNQQQAAEILLLKHEVSLCNDVRKRCSHQDQAASLQMSCAVMML